MTWEMLWAVGRYDLRLGEREFWSLVPRQFMALTRRLTEERKRREYGPALIVSAIAALGGSKSPPSPSNFMPSMQNVKKEEPKWQDLMAKLKGPLEALGGR